MGLERDPSGQVGVSDPRGEGLFTSSWMCGMAVPITASAVGVFWWVTSVIREGKKVFWIREGRACTRVHGCVVRLSPSQSRLCARFGGCWAGTT